MSLSHARPKFPTVPKSFSTGYLPWLTQQFLFLGTVLNRRRSERLALVLALCLTRQDWFIIPKCLCSNSTCTVLANVRSTRTISRTYRTALPFQRYPIFPRWNSGSRLKKNFWGGESGAWLDPVDESHASRLPAHLWAWPVYCPRVSLQQKEQQCCYFRTCTNEVRVYLEYSTRNNFVPHVGIPVLYLYGTHHAL